MRNVTYAGSDWEVIYEGERILHLRSLRDKTLVIYCSTNSEFLSEYREKTKYTGSRSFRDREVNKSQELGPSNNNHPEHRTEATSIQDSKQIQAASDDIRT